MTPQQAQSDIADLEAQHYWMQSCCAALQALRRSVDMGSLAHNTNSRHGANTANKQGDLQAGMARPNSAQQVSKGGATLLQQISCLTVKMHCCLHPFACISHWLPYSR